jgi:undecaprenyl-diphosphatase
MQAIFLGIIEGLTEFLPISSTGHLTLFSNFLNIIQNESFIIFEISIQLGAICAVLFFYWKKLLDIELIKKLIIAFIPTAAIGLFLSKFLKQILTSELLVAVNLIIGGVIIIYIEKWLSSKLKDNENFLEEHISNQKAFMLGIAQSIAIFPGVSRSGAVIVSGLIMKIKRETITEFSFLLAIPTMFAATFYSMLKHVEILNYENMENIGLGFISAFITAILVIKFLLNYIKNNTFMAFGIYRIVFGILVLSFIV